jgi:hypothetical protein
LPDPPTQRLLRPTNVRQDERPKENPILAKGRLGWGTQSFGNPNEKPHSTKEGLSGALIFEFSLPFD